MINKYAEIQDRILLYNACKGILRVKQASLYKLAEDAVDPAPANPDAQQQGTSLTSYIPATVGSVGGGIGGGYLGNRASNWATNKLGLTDNKGGWRKWLGRGIRTMGTISGATLGAVLGGNATHGFARDWSANDLENAKQRAARKAQRQAEIEQAAQQAVEPQA